MSILGILIACGPYYSAKDLKKGVTDEFNRGNASKVEQDRYEWSKLQGNYGLVAFSYRLSAQQGSGEKRDTIGYHSGLRIFEYKFKKEQGDTAHRVIDLVVLSWLKLGFGYNSNTDLHLNLPCLFVKHQLIYGGVVEIDARNEFPEVVAELWPDSLFTDFLAANKDRWQTIPVDTIKINTKWDNQTLTK
jgi:hypothetical protein